MPFALRSAALTGASLAVALAALLGTAQAAPEGSASIVLDTVPIGGIVVGGSVWTYSGPSTGADTMGWLPDRSMVTILGTERGENWIVGAQDWPMAIQDWGNVWYVLDDGRYVYSAFIFVLRPGEVSPFRDQDSPDRYVVVDLRQQMAWAMIGPDALHQMPLTSGKWGFDTPVGEFRVRTRVANERMTSASVGIYDPAEQYDVQRVLFTQYFADGGFALHLNYWQPPSVYGSYPSSHGCVGFLLHDAQYLWLFGKAGMPVIIRG